MSIPLLRASSGNNPMDGCGTLRSGRILSLLFATLLSPLLEMSGLTGMGGVCSGDNTPPVRATEQEHSPTSSTRSRQHLPLKIDLSNTAIEKRLLDDVTYLASDELEGRGVRTKGLELAGDHIASSFRDSGLVTDWYNGTPFHGFRLFSSTQKGIVQSSEMKHDGQEPSFTLKKGVDFTSLSSSPAGKFSFPVVFAGYGITAGDIGYDDYSGIDAQGKAVLVLRHEPQRFDTDSRFNGTENSPHAYIQSKVKNAIAHGATAVIVCTDDAERTVPTDSESPPTPDNNPESIDSLLQTELPSTGQGKSIPVIHIRRTLIEQLLKDLFQTDLASLEKRIDQDLKPASRELPGLTWGGEVTLSRPYRNLRNVVASLEGEGEEKEQTIIVGAHYDHLGRDSYGSLGSDSSDEIHHGADDNASGTAVVMEVARQLAARQQPLKHRVLFIAFSAEELGLIGSQRYVQDPLFPLDETIAMLNLDMVGRLRDGKLTIYGLETGENWKTLISRSIVTSPQGSDFKLALRSGGYGPSDHASFYEKGVPVLHFFTGFHPQYHRPSDVSTLINAEGMRQIAALIVEMVVKLGNDEVTINRRTSRTEDDLLADGELDEMMKESDPPSIQLGIRVQEEKETKGVKVRSVVPNSLADRNGIRVGDLILNVEGQPIESALDIRNILQKKSSGPSWKVGLRRGEIDADVIVKLAP